MNGAGEDRLSLTLAAVAHPVRRRVLELAEGEPVRITAIASAFAISLPAVSQHIRTLEAAGLVRREIRGREHFIAATRAPLDEVERWAAEHGARWQARLNALKTLMEDDHG